MLNFYISRKERRGRRVSLTVNAGAGEVAVSHDRRTQRLDKRKTEIGKLKGKS